MYLPRWPRPSSSRLPVVIRWFVCLFVGHVRTDWMRAFWVNETLSGQAPEPVWTATMAEEIRFCLRCSAGYQARWTDTPVKHSPPMFRLVLREDVEDFGIDTTDPNVKVV